MGVTYAYHSLTRDCGRFRDADLAKILQNATAAPASAFKARGTPEVLRIIEILSIEQGRKWGVCTVRILHVVLFVSLTPLSQLNEFRKFMGLRREPFLDPSLYPLGLTISC
jgi:prostaglandin-endoperoxide synthase 2